MTSSRSIALLCAALFAGPAPTAAGHQAPAPAAPSLARAPVPARAAPPAPFESQRISVVAEGSGPDVILIPGLTASRDMWRSTIVSVPGYRYHLVQVNGFAGTRPLANGQGAVVEPIAGEIARYIRQQRLGRPALIGHSMGGTLAMMIAARQPDLVGRLMVVDMLPQPVGLVGGTRGGLGALAQQLGSTVEGRRLMGALVARFGASPPGRASDPDLVARASSELARTDLAPELPRIRAPMTVLFASPDETAPQYAQAVHHYRAAYSGAATARLRPVPRSGHMIMFDQPVRFRSEVKAFLAR